MGSVCELENIRENKTAKDVETAKKLLNLGIIEKIPSKRNQFVLCRKYYSTIGKKGEYTRIKGLARDTCKELIFAHITSFEQGRLKDFLGVIPNLSAQTISNLLNELSEENKIMFVGAKRNGHWVLKIKPAIK